MGCSLRKTLVKTPAKNLVKNLAKNLIKQISKKIKSMPVSFWDNKTTTQQQDFLGDYGPRASAWQTEEKHRKPEESKQNMEHPEKNKPYNTTIAYSRAHVNALCPALSGSGRRYDWALPGT